MCPEKRAKGGKHPEVPVLSFALPFCISHIRPENDPNLPQNQASSSMQVLRGRDGGVVGCVPLPARALEWQ